MPQPEPPPNTPMPGQQAAAVLGPDNMTKWDALRAVGWWKPFDWKISAAILLTWITVFFWWLFGKPTMSYLFGVLMLNGILLQIWTVMLIFRCADFVLQTRADINLLPHAAARIAVGYMSAGPQGAQKK